MEMETRPSSRKGLYGYSTKDLKCNGQLKGEVYSLLAKAQNVVAIVNRAVPEE